ncbi:MAG TPA: trypsin-like peptidase domain-containing protein, partial [Clostridia bacterium]|nr:trypsin-like peptidase domain-containing protein [Clostridia bacterium]
PFGSAAPQLQGTGSGVIVSEDGYIITNNHVIDGADVITVVFNDTNEEIEAELIGKDARTDLALLKIDKTGLTAIEFAKKEEIRVGELAIAIGNSLGESSSVTTGVVSAIDRSVTIDGVQSVMIQTDAAINPGNSGGALVNARGQLIGINTMKRLTTIGENGQPITIEGVGYAIPIDVVEDIALKLLQDGRVVRAGLGITCLFIEADEQNRTPAGIYVQSVTRDAAAYNAGIRAGDIIVSIEGEQLASLKQLSDFLAKHAPGDKVNMTIYKNGNYQDITVTLTELSED